MGGQWKMGRFTVRHEHTVLGTNITVWLEEMSSKSSSEYRKSTLAMLVPDGDKEPADPEEMLQLQRENLRVHCFVDRAGPALVWESTEAMESKEAGCSAAQITDLMLAHLAHSGFTSAATETARRFPDGAREAGSVADPSNGREVRPAAERAAK